MRSKIYYWNDDVTGRLVKGLKQFEHLKQESFVPVFTAEIICRMTAEPLFKKDDERAVLLWPSGTFHDLSFHFPPSVPYAKSVDDAHCDTFIDPPNFVCAVNHNYWTLAKDPNLKSLEVLGCHPLFMGKNGVGYTGPTVKTRYDESLEKPLIIRNDFESQIKDGETVHKSIDLDVVDGFPCEPQYMQANKGVTIDNVCDAFDNLMARTDVVRLDIGGVWDYALNSDNSGTVGKKAIDAYARVLEVWFNH